MHFHEWNFFISIQISLKFVLQGPIDNKAALILVMAWCQTGDKPIPKPMLTQFTDTYMGDELNDVITRAAWSQFQQ